MNAYNYTGLYVLVNKTDYSRQLIDDNQIQRINGGSFLISLFLILALYFTQIICCKCLNFESDLLQINLQKCIFFTNSSISLVDLYLVKGIVVDPTKVEAIQYQPNLAIVTKLEGFMVFDYVMLYLFAVPFFGFIASEFNWRKRVVLMKPEADRSL